MSEDAAYRRSKAARLADGRSKGVVLGQGGGWGRRSFDLGRRLAGARTWGRRISRGWLRRIEGEAQRIHLR